MGNEQVSPDVIFMNNLAAYGAALELGGCALMDLIGGEELSNVIGGETQEKGDIQEILSARLTAHLKVT